MSCATAVVVADGAVVVTTMKGGGKKGTPERRGKWCSLCYIPIATFSSFLRDFEYRFEEWRGTEFSKGEEMQ